VELGRSAIHPSGNARKGAWFVSGNFRHVVTLPAILRSLKQVETERRVLRVYQREASGEEHHASDGYIDPDREALGGEQSEKKILEDGR
jgi:hypothetical protein